MCTSQHEVGLDHSSSIRAGGDGKEVAAMGIFGSENGMEMKRGEF